MMNLSMTRVKTGTFAISITQGNPPTPLVITNAMTVWFHAAYAGFEINKSSPGGGITIVDATQGSVILQIEPGDTQTLNIDPTSAVAMPCELSLQVLSESYELNRGMLTVLGNVGTP